MENLIKAIDYLKESTNFYFIYTRYENFTKINAKHIFMSFECSFNISNEFIDNYTWNILKTMIGIKIKKQFLKTFYYKYTTEMCF